jgi:hypothetical protein
MIGKTTNGAICRETPKTDFLHGIIGFGFKRTMVRKSSGDQRR